MKLFRKILPLLLFAASLSPVVAQKKKDWSFSDKTGIKGVQMSLGFNRVQNRDYWAKGIFREYIDSAWYGKLNTYPANRPKQFPFMLEVVHAPFRFHTNPYLKRIELTAGFYHNHLSEDRHFTAYEYIDEYNWKVKSVYYELSNRQSGLHLGINLSQPITHSLMVYGGYGFGLNLFGKFSVTRNYYTETNYRQADSMPVQHQRVADLPELTLVYYPKMFSQQFIVGAKAYLTCRINIYAEYNYRTFHVLRPGMADLTNNGHGFVLGIRYKFNPPEPKDPNAPPLEPDAFW